MMKHILTILFAMLCAVAYAQKTYVIAADSTKLTTVNGTGNELIIENDTRDTAGVLYNGGAGRTTFRALRLQQLTDSTFRLLAGTTQQGATIKISPGTGGGSAVTYTMTKKADSIVLSGSNGARFAVRDTFANIVTYTLTLNTGRDSIVLTGSNGARYAVRDSFDSGTLLLDTTEVNYFTVINTQNTPPGGPATGATYTVGTSPTGAWAGNANKIAEWNGASWDFTTPAQGDYYYNQTNGYTFQYRSGAWVRTSSIPVLVNGQSLSSGVRLGTNNARSLSLETNNVIRLRVDSVGVLHSYYTPTAADTSVLMISPAGKITKQGKSTLLAGAGGGSGANIYNSDGAVTDSIRNVRYDGTIFNIYDSIENTFFTMGGGTVPNPLGGPNTTVRYPGAALNQFYWTNDLSNIFGVSLLVDKDAARLNGGAQVYDFINNVYIGGKASVEKEDNDYYYRLFYKKPRTEERDGETLWMTLGSKYNPWLTITPYDNTEDNGDTWKLPWTFMVYDTTRTYFFGTKTDGKVFLKADTDNAVTKVVGWNSTDSTLKLVDVSSLSSGADSATFATKAYVDAKDAQWSVTRSSDSTNIVFTNGSTTTTIMDHGFVLLGEATASGSGVTSIDFTIDTTQLWTQLFIVGSNVFPVTDNVNLYLRLGVGSSPTYYTGATDYGYGYRGAFAANYTLAAQIELMKSLDNAWVAGFELKINNPGGTTSRKAIMWQGISSNEANPSLYIYDYTGSASLQATTRPISGIRFLASSGNITGKFRLYGIK